MSSSSKGGLTRCGHQLGSGSGEGQKHWNKSGEWKRITNQSEQAAGHMVTASHEVLFAHGCLGPYERLRFVFLPLLAPVRRKAESAPLRYLKNFVMSNASLFFSMK